MSYCKMPGFANKCGDGALPGSFCGVSGHQKWVGTTKPRRVHGTRNDIRVPSTQPAARAVGEKFIWEIPGQEFTAGIALHVCENFKRFQEPLIHPSAWRLMRKGIAR